MKEKWKDYYYKGLAVFLTVAMCILFFFAVFRLKELGHYVKVIANILMPFIYGAVIAYLLTPVCNSIENYLADKVQLTRRTPEKRKKLQGLFKGIAILGSILLFCLIIYALIAMLVPAAGEQHSASGGSHAWIYSDSKCLAGKAGGR